MASSSPRRRRRRRRRRRHSGRRDDNLVGPARCGPTFEAAGFQEREPLDLLAGVINCTSFN